MEVGSIFDLDIHELFKENKKEIKFPFEKYYEYKEKKFFNTGRSAIEYLFKFQLKIKNDEIVLLPNFTCSSIIDALDRANVKYEFYNILENFQIDIKDLLIKIKDNRIKAILYINYFGFLQDDDVINTLKILKEKYILVEDNTQALYTSDENKIGIGNYIIASIRKWLSAPDGAVLYSQTKLEEINIDNGYNEYMSKYILAQLMKNEYLKNQNLDKNKYLNLIKDSMNSLFSDYTIRNITEISYNLIKNQNVKAICEKRRENYKYLYENLCGIKALKIPFKLNDEKIVPFGFVIILDERDKFYEYCIRENIYCNIHWKDANNYLSNKIITIPCDQRYSINEMEFIVRKIKEYFDEEKEYIKK